MHRHYKKIFLLTQANVKARYRDTTLGLIWSLLQPLIIVFSQVILFTHLLGDNDSSFRAYVLVGSLIWFYISQSVEKTSLVLKQSSAQYANLYIKPFESVLSCHIENYIQFLLYTTVLFLFVLGLSMTTFIYLLKFVLLSIFLFFFVFAFSYGVALYQVLYKDIKYLCQFFFTTLYFLSPTFYKPEQIGMVEANYLLYLPTTWILDFARLSTQQNLNHSLTAVSLFSVLFLTVGIWSYRTHQKILPKALIKL